MRDNIREMYLAGYTVKEIAKELNKSEGSVKMFISRNLKGFEKVHKKQIEIKKSILKTNKLDRIKQLYVQGLNAKEIANILGESHGHIRNTINQNLKEFRKEHIKSRDLNKSIIKTVKRMNNSYMSDLSLLKQNRQSFKYDKNNNLEFDKENRESKPADIPNKIYMRNIV